MMWHFLVRHRIIIAYDITDNKTRRLLVKILDKYGVRLQMSIFEFLITKQQFEKLKSEITNFYFKAQSAKKHKNSKTLKIFIVPICGSCFESKKMFGLEFSQQKEFIVS